jgi:hypothetical protein
MVAGSMLSLSDRLRMRVESRWRDFAVEAAGTSVGVRGHIAEDAVEAPPGTTLRGTPISCHVLQVGLKSEYNNPASPKIYSSYNSLRGLTLRLPGGSQHWAVGSEAPFDPLMLNHASSTIHACHLGLWALIICLPRGPLHQIILSRATPRSDSLTHALHKQDSVPKIL